MDKYEQAREQRRAIEAELAVIDAKIKAAILGGDLNAYDALTKRKAELPMLYIAASTAEMKIRNHIFNGEDAANAEMLNAAQNRRDELQAELAKMRAKFEQEIADLTSRLQEAEAAVSAAQNAIVSSRNLNGTCDEGFQRAMAAVKI
jgi:hypothetical protein